MKNLISKLSLIDWLVIVGVIALICFTYHTIDKSFNPTDFCEGLMMLLFGHGAHTAGNNFVDNKFGVDTK